MCAIFQLLYSRASFDYRRALLHFTCIAFISTSGAAPTIITVPRLIAAGLLMLRRSLIEFWIFEPFGRHVARDSALCNNTMIGFALTVHQVETFRVPAQIRLHQCKEQTSCSLAGLRHKIFLKFSNFFPLHLNLSKYVIKIRMQFVPIQNKIKCRFILYFTFKCQYINNM